MIKPIPNVAFSLAILAGVPLNAAPDLAKIDRTIVKEPAYETQPRYCLLVFGPNAETRVWLVEDGETLYVDRNANGDLTEQGEALQPTKKQKLSGYRDAQYETVKIVPADGSSTHTEFKIGYYQSDGKPVHHFIKVKVNGKQQQFAGWRPIFSDAQQAAEIFHFGGEFAPRPLRKKQLSLTGDGQELHLSWFTQGLGKDARAMLGYEAVPVEITPFAEIEWPSDEPNETILMKVELVHRC